MRSESDVSAKTDIAIIGGGLTGKMMALTLSHSGYACMLIAPKKSQDNKSQDSKSTRDRRSTTIHHAGAKMLKALGLFDRLSDDLAPIHYIDVAIGAQKPYHSDWLLKWSSQPEPMAYVVENHRLDKVLDEALLAQGDKVRFCDDLVSSYEDDTVSGMIVTDSGKKISATCLIACDGANSPMRKLAGLTPKIEETGQRAIIADLTSEIAHNDTAYQRFLSTGPLALMPLKGNGLSLVWSTSASEADELLSQDDDTFSAAVTNAFGDELGKLTLNGDRASFPLRPHFMRRMGKGRVILAGDAAHAIHPLAGMGYNLALADAAILLDLFQGAHAKGLSCDDPSLLSAYHKRRLPEVLALSTMTSQLNRLLSKEQNALAQLVAISMSIIDKTPLKRAFRDVAMGGKLSSAPLLKGKLTR